MARTRGNRTGVHDPARDIVPFHDGLMAGERLFYDAAMLSEQVGLDVMELRRAAAAHRS
jgi:hypothetical protein